MVKVNNFVTGVKSRLNKVKKWVQDRAQRVGRVIKRGNNGAVELSRQAIKAAPSLYNRVKTGLQRLSGYFKTGANALDQIGGAIGGKYGGKLQNASGKIEQFCQNAENKVGEYHKKGEDFYRKGQQLVNIVDKILPKVKYN